MNKKIEGGDGAVTDYDSPVDNSADRAQQGEPVATEQSYSFRTRPLDAVGRVNGEWSGWMECTREQYNEGIPSPWPREIEYRAATKAAAPEKAQACTCPSGDGSLRWPCPAHPSEAKAGDGA